MSIDHLPSPGLIPLESARRRGSSTWKRVFKSFRQQHWSLIMGSVVFVTIVAILVIAPWIIPHDPADQNLLRRLSGPSTQYWLGADNLGRDLLSRVLMGGRFSMVIATLTLILSAVIGTLLGVISARIGGITDEIVMRLVDLLITFPDVVVAIFMISIFGPGYGTLLASLTIVGWTPFARMARGLTLEINAREYIKAAEVLGCGRTFIMVRHVIPNAIRPIAAICFLRFGHKLITVGSLSFLGLGVQPPDADWGLLLAEAQPYLERAPLFAIVPGLAIFLTALSVTWIGQGLEMTGLRASRGGH